MKEKSNDAGYSLILYLTICVTVHYLCSSVGCHGDGVPGYGAFAGLECDKCLERYSVSLWAFMTSNGLANAKASLHSLGLAVTDYAIRIALMSSRNMLTKSNIQAQNLDAEYFPSAFAKT